ncbi:MAG: GNAT family N-acetyltransferase [Promethearchaeota archaeon]
MLRKLIIPSTKEIFIEMIITAEPEHKHIILDYAYKEPVYNLFVIGDLENFSLRSDIMDIYVDYVGDENGALNEASQIKGLILRFEKNLMPLTYLEDYDFTEFGDLLSSLFKRNNTIVSDNWAVPKVITGKPQSVLSLVNILNKNGLIRDYEFKEADMARLNREKFRKFKVKFKENFNDQNRTLEIIKLNKELFVDDEDSNNIDTIIKDYVRSINSIEEFAFNKVSFESLKRKLINGGKRVYILLLDGRIVSSAATAIESTKSAMIGGVFSMKGQRHKGFAMKIIMELCQDLINEEIIPCLFYENPEAGRIYLKMGFEVLGKYCLSVLKGHE